VQAQAKDYYDWEQHLADDGFLLLAGRVRKKDEEKVRDVCFVLKLVKILACVFPQLQLKLGSNAYVRYPFGRIFQI